MSLSFLKKIFLLIICSFSFQSAFSQNDTPTAEEIIERHLEAIGGREAISKIKTIEFVDKIYTDNGKVKDTIFLHSKIIIGESGYSENKRDSMFSIARDNMAIVNTKGQIMGAIFSTLMEVMGHEKTFEELNFLSDKYRIRYSGQGNVNDSVSAYQITITDLKGISQTRAYDKKTGLLVLKLSRTGQLSYYSDYRKVEGVLFPFGVKMEANKTVVQYIKVNQKFDENIFEWNNEQDKKMIGRWIHKAEKVEQKDTPFLELNLQESRGGEYQAGYFDIEGDRINEARLPILGWQLDGDTLMVQIVDVGKVDNRYFKVEDKTENSFTGRPVKFELEEMRDDEREQIKNFRFYFKKEEE
ncbi:hypothetical protein ACE193_02710 [Bernardetia sp. OM2101]|uniref:hypothetical protein n=1 Tax=Bernardetia sp. OM2101 TaxID=3344876 RepID=UPI0035CFC8C6